MIIVEQTKSTGNRQVVLCVTRRVSSGFRTGPAHRLGDQQRKMKLGTKQSKKMRFVGEAVLEAVLRYAWKENDGKLVDSGNLDSDQSV